MQMVRRAISIKQPFVEQILNGTKKMEFRTVPTNIRERVYLYASLKPRPKSDPSWRKLPKPERDLPVGRIVGTVEIVGCTERGVFDYAYKLANPKRLRKHLVPMNQPGPVFWRPKFEEVEG